MPKINLANLKVTAGRPYPMGPIVYENAVRFTIFSRHATRVWICLFEDTGDRAPVWEYEYDPQLHRTGDVWSIYVEGLREGALYKYRMDGPQTPKRFHRFNANNYLLDPYAKAFVGDIHDGTMKCVAVHDYIDWSRGHRPNTPMNQTIIYETHVRGITNHPTSGVEHRGTYRGLIEKIPYLKQLGITAVELLPIHEFGENLLGRCSLDGAIELTNYWGYSNIGFFAPAGRYAVSAVNREHLDEFREMVRDLHAADIEVILDVVFNHTSEGNAAGPTLSFRGIDNSIYYLLDAGGRYLNYSGCGNTVNCDHPLVRDFILDCLRYWVAVMHVDGFRFDLASILGRDQQGNVLEDAPLVRRIAEDPVLRDTKLIAEAWDAGGAYQVGSFGGIRWAEWNGRYRDDVRRYWRGDGGTRAAFASRITGSADIYEWAGRSPEHSINFVTAHDGYTLRDLVSYTEKHNWQNGEGNRDGSNENYSTNCGVEGPTDDPEINAERMRRQKNFIATLFTSIGVPMLLGGDEFGRTQRGNNNAYCQDNDVSWYDWSLVEKNAEIFDFTKKVIALRKAHPVFRRDHYFEGHGSAREADLIWFDVDGKAVDWLSKDLTLGCRVHAEHNGYVALCILFNPTRREVRFQVPMGTWKVVIDTGQPAPEDCPGDTSTRMRTRDVDVLPVSMVVLAEDTHKGGAGSPGT